MEIYPTAVDFAYIEMDDKFCFLNNGVSQSLVQFDLLFTYLPFYYFEYFALNRVF